jgi:hypothetical protein
MCVVLLFFGWRRIWRMSIPIIWRYEMDCKE